MAAAKCLIAHGDSENGRDALYLAGYAVECSLKALILRRTPRANQFETFQTISQGVKGHDFDRLEGMVKKRGCAIPPDIAKALRRVSRWSPDWRYQVGAIDPEDAAEFQAAVQAVVDWMERSW